MSGGLGRRNDCSFVVTQEICLVLKGGRVYGVHAVRVRNGYANKVCRGVKQG